MRYAQRMMMAVMVLLVGGCAGDEPPAVRELSTWDNPQPIYGTPQRVVVMAKVADDAVRRRIEDETVGYLRRRGVDAVPAYDTLREEDLADERAFDDRIRRQRVDALLRYRVGDRRQQVRDVGTGDATDGTPAGVGFFSFFAGAPAPLGARPAGELAAAKPHLQGDAAVAAEVDPHVQLTADYFRRDRHEPQWSGLYDVDLARGLEEISFELVEHVVDTLRREGML